MHQKHAHLHCIVQDAFIGDGVDDLVHCTSHCLAPPHHITQHLQHTAFDHFNLSGTRWHRAAISCTLQCSAMQCTARRCHTPSSNEHASTGHSAGLQQLDASSVHVPCHTNAKIEWYSAHLRLGAARHQLTQHLHVLRCNRQILPQLIWLPRDIKLRQILRSRRQLTRRIAADATAALADAVAIGGVYSAGSGRGYVRCVVVLCGKDGGACVGIHALED